MPAESVKIVECPADSLGEDPAGLLERPLVIEGEGRIVPAARLLHQAFQARRPRVAKRLGLDQREAGRFGDPCLQPFGGVQPGLFLREIREEPPPYAACVLLGRAGVDEQAPAVAKRAPGHVEKGRHVEMVDRVEGEDGVERFPFERQRVDAGQAGRESADASPGEALGESLQHRHAPVDADQVQAWDMVEQQPVVAPVAAADIGRAHAGPIGHCVAHIVDKLQIGGPDLAVDPRHVGKMGGHDGARRMQHRAIPPSP